MENELKDQYIVQEIFMTTGDMMRLKRNATGDRVSFVPDATAQNVEQRSETCYRYQDAASSKTELKRMMLQLVPSSNNAKWCRY
jgi:hypothetical protein